MNAPAMVSRVSTIHVTMKAITKRLFHAQTMSMLNLGVEGGVLRSLSRVLIKVRAGC
jgi:hypothetical protein